MNLDIQFTGLLLPKSYKKFANTILDGEYIDTDKYNKKISLYAAFDVYYSGEMDYRPFQFRNSKLPNNEQRYYILNDYINEINEGVKSVSETNKMQIVAKQFYFSSCRTFFKCTSIYFLVSLFGQLHPNDVRVHTCTKCRFQNIVVHLHLWVLDTF